MQILVTGKNYSAKRLTEFFSEDKNDIVFNDLDCSFKQSDDVEDFINANAVSFMIDTNCGVVFPDIPGFLSNISSGKKFAYKNKIRTTRFAVFEKPQAALNFIQTTAFPIVIGPDLLNSIYSPFIAETKEKAQSYVDFLFQTESRKILIENYVSGVKYTKYFALDGLNVLDLIDTVNYFDEVSTNNTNYIPLQIRLQIENDVMPKLLDAIMEEEIEFRGIFGVSFVIEKNASAYFANFKPFFADIDIDIALSTIETDLKKLFLSCVHGTLAQDFENVQISPKYAITTDTKGKMITAFANTMSKAISLAEIEGADPALISEAIKHWRN